jgi:PIN domain nuclease of toxin-antitoxin system
VDLLLDTHVLVWMLRGDSRLPDRVVQAIADPKNDLAISAVTAFEYMDLLIRGRLPVDEDIDAVASIFKCSFLDLPSGIRGISALLPNHHRDPVDRMLIAHAIVSGATLISADRMIAQYPVKRLW